MSGSTKAWWHEAAVGIDKWDAEVYMLCESPRPGLIACIDANGMRWELDAYFVVPVTPLARGLLRAAQARDTADAVLQGQP